MNPPPLPPPECDIFALFGKFIEFTTTGTAAVVNIDNHFLSYRAPNEYLDKRLDRLSASKVLRVLSVASQDTTVPFAASRSHGSRFRRDGERRGTFPRGSDVRGG